ncbi:hypothetical protein VPH35_048173 [Triticum aestivum]|uniref:uncharacterized protein isoform X1 n=2 Tax=Triticum aestivum TaxID=4565 RepID=UPI001D03271A|nr:uncharacterized protein LOC123059599 isoform X1 [Triticum aestivum]
MAGEVSGTAPCNARVYVNGVTGYYMRFQAHGRKYSVDIVKGAHGTRIKGSGWKKFTSDFSLRKGAVVIFDLDMRPRQAYVVVQPVEGSISDVDGDVEMIDGDNSDVDEDGGSIQIEYTRGITLNDAQQDILNALVLSFKTEFLGVSFVHCLTTTDTQAGQMKVPERVASSLNIPKEGLAGVRLSSGEAKTRVEYSTSTDGRIAFNKKQWRRFLSKTTREINDYIFMFFKASSKSYMNVTVVVSKL